MRNRACCRGHQTHNHKLLASLRDSIVDKPPYISGTLQLPDSFSLFYRVARDGNAARFEDGDFFNSPRLLTVVFRCINFANATPDELEQLAQTCEAFDGAHAGKMDSKSFATTLDPVHTDLMRIVRYYLLEGTQSTKSIEVELYRLNYYGELLIFVHTYLTLYCCPGKGSFFEPHVDTPRSKNMFGSLVIVFPTFHKGGALLLRDRYEGGPLSLRHRGPEWIVDLGQALASGALNGTSIGYVAFFDDIEHDVAPVTSGHCVTLTYNLYFNDDGGVLEKSAISEHLVFPPKPPNQDGFREAFNALLENPEFMAEGGTLAFGLRHGYPIKHRHLQDVRNILKGSDAVVYQSARALGFEPTLYMYHNEDCGEHEGLVIDQLVHFDNFLDYDYNDEKVDLIRNYIQTEGGIPVRQDGGEIHYNDPYTGLDYDDDDRTKPEPIEWVAPITTYNRMDGVYVTNGPSEDETDMHYVYGDACMIVRIGKAGDRLAYLTVAQIEKAHQGTEHRRKRYFGR